MVFRSVKIIYITTKETHQNKNPKKNSQQAHGRSSDGLAFLLVHCCGGGLLDGLGEEGGPGTSILL